MDILSKEFGDLTYKVSSYLHQQWIANHLEAIRFCKLPEKFRAEVVKEACKTVKKQKKRNS